MIKAQNLTKYYGNNLGIKNVSFDADKNEIIGLLGKNGAGKTTTLNILTGYLSADEGTVEIEGYDIQKNPKQAKSKIGYLPENPPIYMDMTVNEYLNFCAELKGINAELIDKHLNEICTLAGINEVRKRLCKNLSKGYKQRVGLAQALVGNPEILILDEPTIGLDPNQIIQIRELIKALGKKHTIIISSHILGEIARICSRIIIIDKGEVAASDTLENLTKTLHEKNILNVRIKNADKNTIEGIKKLDGVIKAADLGEVEKGSSDYEIEYDAASKARENIFDYAAKQNKKLLQMKSVELTLEDVFLQVTKRGM